MTANDLPPDFAKIPLDSPKATVLASVPGTPESKEALIANSIPQTATITRSEAKLTVQYDGEATFVPIQGTSMTYAKNTSAAGHQGFRQQLLLRRSWRVVQGADAARAVARGRHSAGGDLHHSAEFAAVLRHLREGLRLDA